MSKSKEDVIIAIETMKRKRYVLSACSTVQCRFLVPLLPLQFTTTAESRCVWIKHFKFVVFSGEWEENWCFWCSFIVTLFRHNFFYISSSVCALCVLWNCFSLSFFFIHSHSFIIYYVGSRYVHSVEKYIKNARCSLIFFILLSISMASTVNVSPAKHLHLRLTVSELFRFQLLFFSFGLLSWLEKSASSKQ